MKDQYSSIGVVLQQNNKKVSIEVTNPLIKEKHQIEDLFNQYANENTEEEIKLISQQIDSFDMDEFSKFLNN